MTALADTVAAVEAIAVAALYDLKTRLFANWPVKVSLWHNSKSKGKKEVEKKTSKKRDGSNDAMKNILQNSLEDDIACSNTENMFVLIFNSKDTL